MLFSTLEKTLGDCPTTILAYDDPNADIRMLMNLDAGLQYYPGGALYYGSYDMLYETRKSAKPGDCLLLYLNKENPDPLAWAGFTNVIAIDDIALYNNALLLIQHSMEMDLKLVLENRKVLKMITSGKPIQVVMDQISVMYDRYTDILDGAFNILATSSKRTPPEIRILDKHSFTSIEPGVIKYLRAQGSLERMRSSRQPVYVEDEPRNTYVYSTPIYQGDVLVVGFLTLFVDKGEVLPPVMLEHVSRTADLLSLLMRRSSVNMTNKTTFFTHLLSSMLQGILQTESTYQERFAVFNYDLRKYKRVCVLSLQTGMPSVTNVDTLASTLQTLLPNSVYVNYDGYLVFLISENVVSDLKDNDALGAFLQHSLLKIGVSDAFEDDRDMPEYYETAKAALRLGLRVETQGAVCQYDDYHIYDIIELLENKRNLKVFCFQPLLNLIREDAKAGEGELVKTLFCYLHNALSVQKTCEELFIHRNTLYYRIQKIKEIMECDFTEYANSVRIAVTLQILRYLNIYDVFQEGLTPRRPQQDTEKQEP